MEEIWKDVVGYEGLYKISNLGRVYSLKTGKNLKQIDNGRGYLQVGLWKNGKRFCHKVHRLVAEAFIPNPNNLEEVNHKNEIKTDNRVENLEWCTHAYNTRYGSRTQKQIDKCKNGKLSMSVIQIKPNGERIEYPSQQEAERQTGISQSNISNVLKDKRKKAGGCRWERKSLF